MQPSVTPLTKEEFNQQFWFTPLQMITVKNPLKTDFQFMVELRHFVIKAGAVDKVPGTVANLYLDQMTKILAQNDDKLGLLSDFTFRSQYYKSLIKDVESLIQEHNPLPAYLQHVPDHIKAETPDDTPPWEHKNEQVPSAIPVPNSDMRNTVDPPAEPVEKEFEHDGVKFRMTVNKAGQKMFYKGNKLTSEAEYSKVASMI